MRLTIIPSDSTIYVDSVVHSDLDLSFIPTDIHALQWYDSYGEIEFASVFDGTKTTKQANEIIQALPDWAQQAAALVETE